MEPKSKKRKKKLNKEEVRCQCYRREDAPLLLKTKPRISWGSFSTFITSIPPASIMTCPEVGSFQ
jgi:hypothetical protein